MKIKLIKSVLENFRGISGTFEFGPGRNVFSGPNGSGKTTMYDSVEWCLRGKDSMGKTDFEIKTIKDGQRVQKTDHSTYHTFDVDGTQIEFGRVYRDKWVKKRGAEKVKSGNETDYFVDGLKISKTKFTAKISETFGPHFWECSDIKHVAEMHWKERRNLLMPMVSNVDQTEIIQSIPGFEKLLNNRSVEDAKTYADQRKKDVNKKLSDLDAKIEERGEDQPESGLSLKNAQKAVNFAGAAVDKAQQAIEDFKSGSESVKELKRLNKELAKAQSDFQEKKNAAYDAENERKRKFRDIDDQLKNGRENLQDHRDEKKNLAGKWKLKESERVQVLNSSSAGHPCVYYNEKCPYHGQQVSDEIQKKLESDFNLEKSKKLEAIVAEQQHFIDRANEIKTEISRIESLISLYETEKKKLEESSLLVQEKPKEMIGLAYKIDLLKKEIDSEQSEIPENLQKALDDAKAKHLEALQAEATAKASQGSQTRIEDLESEKKKFAGELERIEQFGLLHQEFNKKMAEAVEKPLNEMFHPVNFRMFKTLENGNIEEVCDVMDNRGNPYNGALSNGERIQAGIAIIRVMQEFYGVDAPVFCDNAEALTNPIALDCQVIELRASDEFEELTKEV
jgi:hypothetical protein